MPGDSIEPTRRKHRRSSSPDDAEEQSKRRKHRHHHRHRHRSSKEKAETTKLEELDGDRIDDTEVELMKLESTTENGVGSLSEVPVKRNDFSGFDYEMEEGEIVEDDGLVDFVNDDSDKFKKDVGFGDIKKNPQSDVEFREIKKNGCDDFNMVLSVSVAYVCFMNMVFVFSYNVVFQFVYEIFHIAKCYQRRGNIGVDLTMNGLLEMPTYRPSCRDIKDKERELVDTEGESSAQVISAEVLPENSDNQAEGADDYVPEPSFAVGKSPSQNGLSTVEMATGTGGLGEGTPKSERSNDMFCDDIFGESPAGARKAGKGDGVAAEKSGLNDNWDDAEGYYGYRFGEVLDGRYEIIAAHGKGVFSTVVRAKDLKAKSDDAEEVAIKIIRNNETMYKAGMEELVILKKLVGADPERKRHCVRFLSTFKYRNHLCLVFESLHMNLREVLKKFGRNIGLKLTAVRAYAKQLFIALKHLKNCGVLHCDIKPDNMLVNDAKNVLKLCDFGNAMFAGKNEITPYLVSRFYRAPEIILGLSYDHPMDIWSVGCCLFELYTGKVLFPGATNNDMLRLHMELKGPFPKKMLRKGAFTDQHFDQDLNFLATDEDPVSKKPIRRLIVNIKPKDFSTLISGSPGDDPKMVANFRDLMEKIFVLDPDKRMNVSQALSHPFITGK
ncbi:serine/threonine-protein kinase prp4 [Salvia hispanica]|uniref:serine/threonine-protein kinase prp4 n=1 Tax=Salvia hispanica TaxID=49212 RepID=UPI00200981E3|nr:serine/threonine-protein kinase prp4 [Salvia hispanica]